MSYISVLDIYFRKNGFTFIEVAIAISIISIGLVGLNSMVVSTIRGTTFNKNYMMATVLSEDKIERIRIDDFDNVVAENYPAEPYNTMEDFEQFRRVVTIDPKIPPGANTKTITVTVSWRNQTGQTRNVQLSTIIKD